MPTDHVPDADRQATLVHRLELLEESVRKLLQIEEEECRQYERCRIDRGAELCKLSRKVELLRMAVTLREVLEP